MKVSEVMDLVNLMEAVDGAEYTCTPNNVYQKGCVENREIIGKVLDNIMLPGSRIQNSGPLIEIFGRCAAGESCLLLIEHYSNFDYPLLYRLIENTEGLGKAKAATLLPIRGMKLSEISQPMANATRSYDTIMIYPSRSLDAIKDPDELARVKKISIPINHAAIKTVIEKKHNGRLITVFPSGTRYRPWDPDTRKGVREIYSYLKIFDNVIFMAINGNLLKPNESDDMLKDTTVKDIILMTCSEIFNARKFKNDVLETNTEGKDPRQFVVDAVMKKLFAMHEAIEPQRLAEKARLTNQ